MINNVFDHVEIAEHNAELSVMIQTSVDNMPEHVAHGNFAVVFVTNEESDHLEALSVGTADVSQILAIIEAMDTMKNKFYEDFPMARILESLHNAIPEDLLDKLLANEEEGKDGNA